MRERLRRRLFGLHPATVDAELAAEESDHQATLEGARQLLAHLTAEEQGRADRVARLTARLRHLQTAVSTMAVTQAREERMAIRAEERLNTELAALETAYKTKMGELRREEAALRALLHRDVERFRALVARLRDVVTAHGEGDATSARQMVEANLDHTDDQEAVQPPIPPVAAGRGRKSAGKPAVEVATAMDSEGEVKSKG
jgi:chromosome segregation ATPase